MRLFDRKPQQALHAAIFQAMQKGSQILASNKLCLVARDDAADVLASSHNHSIYTLRVAATPSADAQSLVDMCIWPAHGELTKFTCRAPSSQPCTCHTVKLSLNHETRKGSGFCTCPNTSALLCKHIHASVLFLGGFEVCGLEMDDLRQDEDLDFVFAEKDADAGDDCMADPADVDPDPLVATMLDSDEEDTGTVDTVLAEACAKLELDIIRAMETMLLESKLPKKQLDEVCQRVIYSTTHRIQLGKTKIVPPNRQGRPAAFAGRGGSGPRPIPTSAKSDAFRAAVKIGRPKTTGAADAPRRFPLPPLDDIQKRLGSQARSPPKVVLGPSTTGTALMDGVTSSRSTSVVTVHVPLAVSVSTPRASTAPKRRQPAMTKGEAGVSLQDSPIKKKPAASAAMAADSAV